MRVLFIFLLPLVLIACSDATKKVVAIHPEGFYKEIFYITKDSVKHGKYLRYYSNDQLADSCNYVNGEISGLRKIFTEEGQLEVTESYVDGVFEGPYSTYYSNGDIRKIQYYTKNFIQGEVKEFYRGGKLKAIIQFVDNLENGPFTEYFINGNLHWEGFYKDGDFEQDTLKEYNEEGDIIRKLFCEKGICQTVWTPSKGYIKPGKVFEN